MSILLIFWNVTVNLMNRHQRKYGDVIDSSWINQANSGPLCVWWDLLLSGDRKGIFDRILIYRVNQQEHNIP
jgi:hypothetical protein